MNDLATLEPNELFVLEDDKYILSETAQNAIIEVVEKETAIKELKKQVSEKLLQEMESKDIKKVETDFLSVTYIAPTDKETFNSKKLKEDNPDLYDEYVDITPVKSSVRIKVK